MGKVGRPSAGMRETAVPSALEAAALVKQHWGNRSEPYVYARVLLGAAQLAQKEYEDSVKTYQEAYATCRLRISEQRGQ